MTALEQPAAPEAFDAGAAARAFIESARARVGFNCWTCQNRGGYMLVTPCPHKCTLKELAPRLGLSVSSASRVLAGKVAVSLETALRLAQILELRRELVAAVPAPRGERPQPRGRLRKAQHPQGRHR